MVGLLLPLQLWTRHGTTHTTKATDCGCAAGCFTGGCAPQLYAMGFERAGVDLSTDAGKSLFSRFLSTNAAQHSTNSRRAKRPST